MRTDSHISIKFIHLIAVHVRCPEIPYVCDSAWVIGGPSVVSVEVVQGRLTGGISFAVLYLRMPDSNSKSCLKLFTLCSLRPLRLYELSRTGDRPPMGPYSDW